jgi:hypothetical protein
LLGCEAAREISLPHEALRVRVVAGPPGSRRVILDDVAATDDIPRSPSSCIELGEQGEVPYQLQVYAAQTPGSPARSSPATSSRRRWQPAAMQTTAPRSRRPPD